MGAARAWRSPDQQASSAALLLPAATEALNAAELRSPFLSAVYRSPNESEGHWLEVVDEEGSHTHSTWPLSFSRLGSLWFSFGRMAAFLRGRLTGSSGKLASALLSHSLRGEAPLGRLLVRGSPRLLHHRSLPARTSLPPAQEDHAGAGATPAGAVDAAARQLQEELFRVLCEPRPSSPSLLALVRGIVAAGAEPTLEVVQALADHFSESKDAKSLKVRSGCCTG